VKHPPAALALVALLAPVLTIWVLMVLHRVRRLLRDVEQHINRAEPDHQPPASE
jgi:hypothetical protein